MAPSNISHYIVAPPNGNQFNVHTNNTNSRADDKAIVQGILNGFITPLSGTGPAVHSELSTTTSVYRKMCDAEVRETIANRGLAPSIKNTNSRKYLTDSLSKANAFSNRAVSAEHLAAEKIVEFRVNKNNYRVIKEQAIPQLNARRVNPTADVYNLEGIRPNSTKVNLGIHKNNITHFNNNVKDIYVLNPKSPWVKNRFLRYIKTHKFRVSCIAFSVIFEGVNIGIAIYQDGNKVGERTVGALSSATGAAIGAAICSVIPGIGTLLGGFIGGLIGGLAGSGIGSVICSYIFPATAQGNGPPPMEYLSLWYGLPECEFKNDNVYGAPATEYGDSDVYGAPEMDYDHDVSGAPSTW